MFHLKQFFYTSGAKLKLAAIATITIGALFVTGAAQAVIMAPNGITTKSAPLARLDTALVQQVHYRTYTHRHHNNHPGADNGKKRPDHYISQKQCRIVWKRRKAYRGKYQVPSWYSSKCVAQYGYPPIGESGTETTPVIPQQCKKIWRQYKISLRMSSSSKTRRLLAIFRKCMSIYANTAR